MFKSIFNLVSDKIKTLKKMPGKKSHPPPFSLLDPSLAVVHDSVRVFYTKITHLTRGMSCNKKR